MEETKSDFVKEVVRKAEKEDFSGVISIFKDTTELLKQSFGLRNRAENLPNETDTGAVSTKSWTIPCSPLWEGTRASVLIPAICRNRSCV